MMHKALYPLEEAIRMDAELVEDVRELEGRDEVGAEHHHLTGHGQQLTLQREITASI
jgi:hypothetical protein